MVSPISLAYIAGWVQGQFNVKRFSLYLVQELTEQHQATLSHSLLLLFRQMLLSAKAAMCLSYGTPIVAIFLFIVFISIGEGKAVASTSQVFTFAHPKAFLRIEPDWPLPERRELSFKFRTHKPHGLLVYHGGEFPNYDLYVMLQNGRLKIIHIFGHGGTEETYFIGKGLNRDKWHEVFLRIEPGSGKLVIQIDNLEEEITIPSLIQHPFYDLRGNKRHSFLYFGGTNQNKPIWGQKYNYVPFVGCLGEIRVGCSSEISNFVSVSSSENVKIGCIDLCIRYDRCLHSGRCINHYTHTTCDCLGTGHEDWICGQNNLTTITLRGYSYLSYRVYDWQDRVHSDVNKFSITFKSYVRDGVLMYGTGEHPRANYMALSIAGGSVYFEINFGDGPVNITLGDYVDDKRWHNVTVLHHGKKVYVMLDRTFSEEIEIFGKNHHLHLDPELFIGAAPVGAKGLPTRLKFIGCLKTVYFNEKNILYGLHEGDNAVKYHSIFPPEYGCEPVTVIPMTFPFLESHLALEQPSRKHLQLSLEFKTKQYEAVIASAYIKTEKGLGYWEIRLAEEILIFSIVSDKTNPRDKWIIKAGKNLNDHQWHQVGVKYDGGEIHLIVDYQKAVLATYTLPLEFLDEVFFAGNPKNPKIGLIGCLRDIYIQGKWIDPRTVVGTKHAPGKVSMDNCQLVDLCKNPSACEHGGHCYLKNNEVKCNCSGTGYTGDTCYFSIYKRTCQELFLVGYRESGVYKIDIDRNGPLPPSNVYCDMSHDGSGAIITRIENNVPPEMEIRKADLSDFYIDVTYREFTPKMIQSLVHQSKHCSQYIKYDCFKSPLGLRSYTWMTSTMEGHYVTSFGDSSPDRCKCGEDYSCANSTLKCNCDAGDERWRYDEGTFTKSKDLGITRLYVLQPHDMPSDSEARLTLGPVECVETNTQEYVITFKTYFSYLKVPGWRSGDLAFSFRTSSSRGIILYQPPLHPGHGYFRVLLTGDYELAFEFAVNNKLVSKKVVSKRKLNSGEWQQVWVDHDNRHMRFTVNLESFMMDLKGDEEVAMFEGPLYVGGAPKHEVVDLEIKDGFIGCFRGLVVNDQVVDLYKYLTRSAPDIVKDCSPSCSPNPCQNGGTCEEFWGSYKCYCANPIAHTGDNCEHNINSNGMIFVTPRAYIHNVTEGDFISPVLEENILLCFRTFLKKALLLYAFDHLNNFVMLHFEKGSSVFFTFNSLKSIVQGKVEVPDISNGQPVQIKVERGQDKTVLTVNSETITIEKPIKFLVKYERMPWREGQELELVEPARGSYPTVPHSETFLGGVNTETLVSRLPGFVGCLQGLQIGDSSLDLEAIARDESSEKGEFRPGCNMICDTQPCKHGGTCLEDFKNNATTCDCSLTSYLGETCERNIGGAFNGDSVVKYEFTADNEEKDDIKISLAFSTSSKSTSKQALFFMSFAPGKRYFLISLSSEEGLLIEEYFESSTVLSTTVKKENFNDGYRHSVYYQRKGTNTKIMVDRREVVTLFRDIGGSSIVGEKPLTSDLIVIGSVGIPNDPRFGDYFNFKGCISNVVVMLKNTKIMPLEETFGYSLQSDNEHSHLKVEGQSKEEKCADFSPILSPITEPPVIPPEIKGLEWNPEHPVMVPYTGVSGSQSSTLEEVYTATTKVAAVLAVILGLVILGVAIYVYRTQQRYKREKYKRYTNFVHTSKRSPPPKEVTFSSVNGNPDPIPETHPLHEAPELAELRTKSYVNNQENFQDPEYSPSFQRSEDEVDAIEMAPLRPSSSQELEWDPAADTDLMTMDEMNTEEPEEEDQHEDNYPITDSAVPLASTSEHSLMCCSRLM
ncbi:axotactin isoform X3 [Tachypleus tridentatus]|uniref:axotactin isoform X3 n=1 Tax=Tachypleus tridentatus TaxID=6853 RepID=UPI003FD3C501